MSECGLSEECKSTGVVIGRKMRKIWRKMTENDGIFRVESRLELGKQ